jgi:two-component system, NtrC family, sensor histidine kinase KinB
MAGSVRNKIRLGTLFLFALLVLLGGVSIYFLLKIKNDSQRILTANYESIGYCTGMQRQLDSLSIKPTALASFNQLLQQQENNITESGEQPVTQQLRTAFTALQKDIHDTADAFAIRRYLQEIITLNMQAIQRKSQQAEDSAEDATTAIMIISTLSIIVGLSFAFNFPSVVVNPVNKLIEAIGEISKRNYKYRIHLDNTKDEFGQLADSFNEMAERLEYFESSNLNKIIFEKTRAEAVINSLKDASIGIDKNNTVLFANNQALQLLGLQAKDIVGVKTDEVGRRNDLFRFLLEEKGSAPFKIVVDNRENYFTKEVLDIAQGENNNRVIVLKNITSFKELDVAKNNFIATISHELKTPLASSDFSLKLLEDERISKLTDEQKELLHNLKTDNQRMLRILSELLNMSQVEAGKIQLEITDVNPYTLAEGAINTVLNAAREKNISLQKAFAPNLPNIKADAEKTGWVLNNFLTNACKYAPNGSSITIKITANEKDLIISVADKGQGIPAEYLPKVFDRFFKVPGSKTGTGLGLAISKEFIEAEGGQIWVKSEMGAGSEFGFNLPKA